MTTYYGNFCDKMHYDTDEDRTIQYKYRVTITEQTAVTRNIQIVDPTENYDHTSDVIMFSPDPVHIKCDRSDLTQLIIISQAEIRLKVNADMYNAFFANTNRDIKVTIERINEEENYQSTLFFGYVDPLQFDQGFAHNFEEITINATDPLGALQDLKISDIEGVDQTTIISIQNLIFKICQTIFKDAGTLNNIVTFERNNIDISKVKVNASVFFGDSEDDYMTLYEVLDELLKYAGCTIAYEPQSKNVIIYNIYSNYDDEPMHTWFDVKKDSMDASASVSVDTAYSQVNLTCEIEPNDDTLDLTSSDLLYSDYSNYQKYMTELISEKGDSLDAYKGFIELMTTPDEMEYSPSWGKGYRIDNFVYVKRNDAWDFGTNSYIEAMGGRQPSSEQGKSPMTGDQSKVLSWMKQNPMKAAFISFGKGKKNKRTDNSPINNISMKDYLVISIGGHNDHRQTNGHNSIMSYTIERNKPICTFKGLQSMNLTPPDAEVTNYIVISGNILLNPMSKKTGPLWDNDLGHIEAEGNHYDDPGWSNLYSASQNTVAETRNWLMSTGEATSLGIIFTLANRTIPFNGDESSAYYAQKWYELDTSYSGVSPRDPHYKAISTMGIDGDLGNTENVGLKYSWTEFGNDDDKISKVPILACKLKVGDKYCVERLDKGAKGQGVFEWMTYDEWYDTLGPSFEEPYFTIGIDPETDDKLVGKSYSIQNNISYTMNVDASGTAIPIILDDKLNGTPEFTILGPINSQWNQIERIHESFWRSESWHDHLYWTLELLDSIMISDFKIDFKTDYGLYNNKMTNADNDLVYASAMNPKYTEKLDCDIKICTPLTLDECIEKGVKYQTSNSYTMTTDDDPFYGWSTSNSSIKRKPEELYVDYLYKQYNKPARIVNINVDSGYIFGQLVEEGGSRYIGFSTILSQYTIDMQMPGIGIQTVDPATGKLEWPAKQYYAMSMDWSLKNRTNTMSLREKLLYTDPFALS